MSGIWDLGPRVNRPLLYILLSEDMVITYAIVVIIMTFLKLRVLLPVLSRKASNRA